MKRKKKTADLQEPTEFRALYAQLSPEKRELVKDMLFLAETATEKSPELVSLLRAMRQIKWADPPATETLEHLEKVGELLR